MTSGAVAAPDVRLAHAVAAEAQRTVVFAIHGPIARSDLPGLTARVCSLLDGSGARLALCDVDGVRADAVTVDALARLQLAAGRYRCQVRLRNVSGDLLALLAFMGLPDVLPQEGSTSPVAAEGRTSGRPVRSTGRT